MSQKPLRGWVQRYILAELEQACGATVSVPSLARGVYGSDSLTDRNGIINAVRRLRKSRPDLDIRGFNGGGGGAENGGYQLRRKHRASLDLFALTFPEMLHALRERDGMSQAELARSVGVNPPYISRAEGGKAPVSRAVADTMTVVFDLDTEDRDRFLIAAGFWPWMMRPKHVEQIIGAVRRRPPQEKAS